MDKDTLRQTANSAFNSLVDGTSTPSYSELARVIIPIYNLTSENGNESLMISWEELDYEFMYGSSISGRIKLNKVILFYNDDRVNATLMTTGWKKREIYPLNNQILVEGLTPGQRVSYYLMLFWSFNIINNNDGRLLAPPIHEVITDINVSEVIPQIVKLELNNFDGRSTNLGEENEYYVNINNYNNSYGSVSFLLLNEQTSSTSTPQTVVRTLLKLQPLSDSNQNSSYVYAKQKFTGYNDANFFKLSLSEDISYELSAFYQSQTSNILSPLSNTMYIYVSKRFFVNVKPQPAFNYVNGTVTLSSSFSTVNSTYPKENLLLLTKQFSNNSYSTVLQKNIYNDVKDLTDTTDINISEIYSVSNGFYYNTPYRFGFSIKTDDLDDSGIPSGTISDTFYIMKKPEPPTIIGCTVLNDDVTVSWMNGEMYSSTPDGYTVYFDADGELTKQSIFLDGEVTAYSTDVPTTYTNGLKSKSFNMTALGLTNGVVYSVRVVTKVRDLNFSNALISSNSSVSKQVQCYRIGVIEQTVSNVLRLTLDNTANSTDVASSILNGVVELDWVMPSQTDVSGLTLKNFIIHRNGTELETLRETSTTYVDSYVKPQPTYQYQMSMVLETTETVNGSVTIRSFESNLTDPLLVHMMKKPEPPTIIGCTVLNDDVTVSWTNAPVINNYTPYEYTVYFDAPGESTKPSTFFDDSHTDVPATSTDVPTTYNNGLKSKSFNMTTLGLTNGVVYSVSVVTKVRDLNSSNALISSNSSVSKQVQCYRIGVINQTVSNVLRLTLDNTANSTDVAESILNGYVELDWVMPSQTDVSGLTLKNFIIYRDELELKTLGETLTTCVDSDVKHEPRYEYQMSMLLEITETVNGSVTIRSFESNLTDPLLVHMMKKPEPPTIIGCTVLNDDVTVSWTNAPVINNYTPYEYTVYFDAPGESTKPSTFFDDSHTDVPATSTDVPTTYNNGLKSKSFNMTTLGLTNGVVYSVSVVTKVRDLNSSNALISSNSSVLKQVQCYRQTWLDKFNVDFDKVSANTNITINWIIPSNDLLSNLTINSIKITQGNAIIVGDLTKTTTTYNVSGLTNFTTYVFVVTLNLNATETVNGNIITKELYVVSNQITATPWSLPSSGPVLKVKDDNPDSIGNHYIDLEITNVPDTGLSIASYKYFYNRLNVTVSREGNSDTRISGLDNDIQYEFWCRILYTNPNNSDARIEGPDSLHINLTPTYKDNRFNVTNLSVSDIGNKTVKLNWARPELVLANSVDVNMEFKHYDISLFNVTSQTSSPIAKITDYNNIQYVISSTDTVLSNGITYNFDVKAVYQKNNTELPQVPIRSLSFTPFQVIPFSISNIVNDYVNGDISFDFNYDTAGNSGQNYLNNIEILADNLRIATLTDVPVGSSSFKIFYNQLVEYTVYNLCIVSNFNDPNNTSQLLFARSPNYQIQSVSKPSKITDLKARNVDAESITLVWNEKFEPYNFSYKIEQIEGTYTDIIDVPSLRSPGTRTHTFNNLTLGDEYTYRIYTEFIHRGITIQSDKSVPIKLIPYATSTDVPVLTGEAFNRYIELYFEREPVYGGLPVDEYIIEWKATKTEENLESEGSETTDVVLWDFQTLVPYSYTVEGNTTKIQSLDNGTYYTFRYKIVTNNTENYEDRSTGDSNLLSEKNISVFSHELSLMPVTGPEPPNEISISDNSGLSAELKWRRTNQTGGANVVRYDVFEKLSDSLTWVPLNSVYKISNLNDEIENGYTLPITKTNTELGLSYDYSIVTVVNNAQDPNSRKSDLVIRKTFFEDPKPIMSLNANYVNVTGSTSAFFIEFETDYQASIGLAEPKIEVNIREISTTTNTTNQTIDFDPTPDKKLNLTTFGLTGGKQYSATVYVKGKNPNNLSKTIKSNSINLTFGTFDKPILNEFTKIKEGNGYMIFSINANNGLNTNNTIFQYHKLDVFNYSGALIESYVINQLTTSSYRFNLVNSTAENPYTFKIKSICKSPIVGRNDLLESNEIELQGYPRVGYVPSIQGHTYDISKSTLIITIDNHDADSINAWDLKFLPLNGLAEGPLNTRTTHSSTEVYKGTIQPAIVTNGNTVTITIPIDPFYVSYRSEDNPMISTTKSISVLEIQFRFKATNENGESTKYYYPADKAQIITRSYNDFTYLVSQGPVSQYGNYILFQDDSTQ